MKHERIRERTFPAWHFAMLNDDARNTAIEAAIRDLDPRGKTVFEIGAGAGLVAMMFARHGAAKVVTCEVELQLAEVARRAVRANGFAGTVEVLAMSSAEAIDRGLVPFEPDIVFTETIDCGLVGEGFAAIARDVARIATPRTVILPQRLVQLGYLVECEDIWRLNRAETCCGLDLGAIDDHTTAAYFPVRAQAYRVRSLSPVLELRTLDYGDPGLREGSVRVEPYADGLCHGLVSFFRAHFGSHVVTNDVRDAGHWHQAFHPLPARTRVRAGESRRVTIEPNGRIVFEEADHVLQG